MSTLKDVATLACVDASTVSRALNNHPGVHAETKKRILKAVEQLSYRPNLLAKNLRQGKRHTIGIVVPRLHLSVFSTIAQAIEVTARDQGYATLLCSTAGDPKVEKEGLNRLRNGLVDGIILAGTGRNKKLARDIQVSGVPITQIVRIQDDSLSSVTVDYEKCGAEAVHYLYKNSCRHIGLITGSMKLSPYHYRYQGYKKALKELGLSEITAEAKEENQGLDYGYQATQLLLTKDSQLDAIMAATDAQGIGAMRALKEAGKKIPRDIRIISLTGHDLGRMVETTMTTMEMPAWKIGEKAAQLVLEQIEGKGKNVTPIQHVVYDSVLIQRESA